MPLLKFLDSCKQALLLDSEDVWNLELYKHGQLMYAGNIELGLQYIKKAKSKEGYTASLDYTIGRHLMSIYMFEVHIHRNHLASWCRKRCPSYPTLRINRDYLTMQIYRHKSCCMLYRSDSVEI